MSLLIVRHGETQLNVARTLQPADTPLSPRGRAQARAVGERLRELGVAQILSSDLPRALQTAEAIAAATGAPIETTPLLQERNYGDWRGRRYDELGLDPLVMEEAPPGGESGPAFRQRVALAFARAVQLGAPLDGHLAVVTHGLVIRAMAGQHLRLPTDRPTVLRFDNTSLTTVSCHAPHDVELLDCTRHLEGLPTPGGGLSGG
ncbi:histidine phosphatase family protein [Caldimonas brevitalea]|uniref:Phosphoglycerate mutase family n=1 Tax=Caldimonas brevitalea TaxID=413882 RepID=A0A0G3BDQ3_9BURK|nr:histidine phosphatase family protein [Caldimonas brevitalea]AKJ27417.1 phosphoglycerate mutase family [Caldimonas brevitalea]